MKNILVTGAAGGMGAAVCRKFIDNGWRVFALDLKKSDICGSDSMVCDLTDNDSVENAFRWLSGITDHLDAIVHAAGIYDLDSLTELDEKRFRRIVGVNFAGPYRINRTFTPLMGNGGRIVIITSELAPLDPLPFTGIYAVTKAALEKYAHSLRSELLLRGINVSVIRPGAVDTGLIKASTRALERFCENTKYYKCNAANFRRVVDSVEARSVKPEKIGDLAEKALTAKNPKYVYSINRNPLLLILSSLPDRLQQFILEQILK